MARVVNCALMMRCFACSHFSGAANDEDYLKDVAKLAFMEPFILASMDENLYTKMREATCLPILTVSNGRRIILPFTLSHKEKLAAFKERRLHIEDKDLKKRLEVSFTSIIFFLF
ncbi:hypothetical protein R6Q59_017022 [Mikania micrantha]